MAAQIVPFTFQQHHPVRVTLIEDEPWFCLPDVCKILEVDRSSNLIKNLDKKGWVKNLTLTQGGEQEVIFINEPNLYRVIFRSNKPEAKAFQDWVFDEVLPAIRKTGRYEQPQPTLTAAQWQVIRGLIHGIACCCKFQDKARFAVNERLRFAHAVRNVADLRPEHFEDARADLEGLRALSEQQRPHDRPGSGIHRRRDPSASLHSQGARPGQAPSPATQPDQMIVIRATEGMDCLERIIDC